MKIPRVRITRCYINVFVTYTAIFTGCIPLDSNFDQFILSLNETGIKTRENASFIILLTTRVAFGLRYYSFFGET